MRTCSLSGFAPHLGNSREKKKTFLTFKVRYYRKNEEDKLERNVYKKYEAFRRDQKIKSFLKHLKRSKTGLTGWKWDSGAVIL